MTKTTEVRHDQGGSYEVPVKKRISVVLPVLAPTPFLRAMTEFCIRALRAHADAPFDLIVVEAGEPYFQEGALSGQAPLQPGIDKHLSFNPKIGGVREINAGIRAADTEFVVTAGNDVIVPPHWDTELLRCFSERPNDCGIAALSACEPGVNVGPGHNLPLIVEGMYSPFNMFRKIDKRIGPAWAWEYDESYLRVYQDSDLIMRMYENGLRAFRSCRAHVHHLLRMTNDSVGTAAHNVQLAKDEELFYRRWGKSPLAMFAMIRAGAYGYGREHESFLRAVGNSPDHVANRVARS